MSFRNADLSAISYANGFTLWHYRSPDSLDDMLMPGYFDQAHKMLRAHDFIHVNALIDDARPEHGTFVVGDSSAECVRVALGMRVRP